MSRKRDKKKKKEEEKEEPEPQPPPEPRRHWLPVWLTLLGVPAIVSGIVLRYWEVEPARGVKKVPGPDAAADIPETVHGPAPGEDGKTGPELVDPHEPESLDAPPDVTIETPDGGRVAIEAGGPGSWGELHYAISSTADSENPGVWKLQVTIRRMGPTLDSAQEHETVKQAADEAHADAENLSGSELRMIEDTYRVLDLEAELGLAIASTSDTRPAERVWRDGSESVVAIVGNFGEHAEDEVVDALRSYVPDRSRTAPRPR